MATVQYHLENTPEKIQALFRGLQEKILALGDDLEVYLLQTHRTESKENP